MTRRRVVTFFTIIALASLSACGKVGSPKRPEGAPEPRQYPAPAPLPQTLSTPDKG